MSPIPDHTILPATEADITTLTDFLVASKLQLAINRFLFKDWPATDAQRANYKTHVESGIKNPRTTSLKVVHDGSGKIVAYLYLTKCSKSTDVDARPEAGPADNQGAASPRPSRSSVPDALVPSVVKAMTDAMKELEPDIVGGEYFEITHIYVDPMSRKQGIGTALTQLCHDQAQAEDLPLTICAEPNHHDFFSRRGFGDVEHVDIDLRRWAAENSGYGVFRVSRMM
ncbi:hypothetical protein GGR54DRAFT_588213 [Hypoxylon sp. NC1633]|nr:hypothetical protein GGR54DRAFT_588213 [Hypoxylon sp. NC1633]